MPNLTILNFYEDSSITLLSIKDNPVLTNINCNYTLVDALDATNNPLLTNVSISYSSLTSLNINTNPLLTYVGITSCALTFLNIVNVPALISLSCDNNALTSLDVSQHTNLLNLSCKNNQLSSLIFNDNIETLICNNNVLTCIDVNSTTNLTYLNCSDNMLEQLTIKNNNWSILDVNALSNNLTCVEVDNLGFATNNWDIDAFASFSLNCNYVNPCSNTSTAIQEHTTNKELLKVTDILGREIDEKRNTPLFYIYNDGTVEKRIVIE